MPEKRLGADLLREKIGFAALRSMELEIGSLTGAGYGGNGAKWLARHNGSAGYLNFRSCRLLTNA
jgi:putative transposase